MPNPVLNEKTFGGTSAFTNAELTPGWGAGTRTVSGSTAVPAATNAMTINGSIVKTFMLVAILIAAGIYGWSLVDTSAAQVQLSGTASVMLIGCFLGALALGFITAFVPKASPITAPLYAVAEGVVVGVMSALYNAEFDGIVLQAVAVTIGVFVVILSLYTSRAVRVTPRLQRMIIGATVGVLVAYLGIFLASFFTNSIAVFSSGPIGIVFSLIVAGVAAFNLLLDFSFIEQGAETQAPKVYEWYCGFGLLVTIVWLYLSILRLLAAARR